MSLFELFITAVALSMDAFAVAMCKGLSVKEVHKNHFITVGLYFGGFQAIMPLIGFLVGFNFRHLVESFDHWIAFILLGFIGFNMIKESLSHESEDLTDEFSFKAMFPLAIATSIDALAVGVSYSFLPEMETKILPAIIFIGVTTFTLSAIGVRIGNHFGVKYTAKAEFVGGIILIIMGIKILLEHLEII